MQLKELLLSKDDNKVFVFQSLSQLHSEQISYIHNKLHNDFFTNWHSHESKINPELIIENNHFIIISSNTSHISGCAIDALTHYIKQISLDLKVNLFNRIKISFFISKYKANHNFNNINNADIIFLDYKDFVDKYRTINKNIFIFNTAINSSGDLWIMSLENWKTKYLKN